jgi:ATP-dependent Lon protease
MVPAAPVADAGLCSAAVDGTRDLGLFPLDLVLVPGERIPLHLFEPRYRQLYADCVLEDRPFTLVRVEGGATSRIGCAARFDELVQRLEDGRLTVVVVGEDPVEILEETEGHLYFSALCRTLRDEDRPVDAGLTDEVTRRFGELSRRLTGEERRPPAPDGVPLSYAVAGAVELPVELKQVLLETREEDERLRLVSEALSDALRVAARAEVAAERASTNGRVGH